MAISSINFQKAYKHYDKHNFRTAKKEPDYLLPVEHRKKNEYKRIYDFDTLWEEQKKYISKFSNVKKENTNWEAVVNLNSNHSMQDMEKLVEMLEKELNIKCMSIAIHRDEGHINEFGEAKHNLHCHINFFTMKEGKQMWRRQYITPSKLKSIQTKTADILQMERGKDYKIGDPEKPKRLSHREYRKMKIQQEKNEKKFENEMRTKIFNVAKNELKDFEKNVEDLWGVDLLGLKLVGKEGFEKSLKKITNWGIAKERKANQAIFSMQQAEKRMGDMAMQLISYKSIIENNNKEIGSVIEKNIEMGVNQRIGKELDKVKKQGDTQVSALKEQLKEVERKYNEARNELMKLSKNGEMVSQKDYMDLKERKDYEISNIKKQMTTMKEEMKKQREENLTSKLEIEELKSEIEGLKRENEKLKPYYEYQMKVNNRKGISR